jgi:hypothetical protein
VKNSLAKIDSIGSTIDSLIIKITLWHHTKNTLTVLDRWTDIGSGRSPKGYSNW